MNKSIAFMVVNLVLTGSTNSEEFNVAVNNMRFNPNQVLIQQGDTVIWTNEEKRGYHTVLFRSGAITAESPPLFPGETWRLTFRQLGKYEYMCGPHPDMVGTVTVTGN
jgi:plastocyanin